MKCFKCKREIESTSKICPHCGEKQGFDQEVIDRAIQGENEAQAELYNHTYSDVYYTIFTITKDEDLLFDVLQDTYLTAFQKLDQLKNADSFRPWIKRIAHNKTLNALRDRKSSKMIFLVSPDTEEAIKIKDDRIENMPEEKIDQQETQRLIKEILEVLPEDQRAVIGMYYFDQLSVDEIAKELGCGANTVKSRLYYGRKKIETQVLELEKRGTKLYNLAPIPFFLWLLRSLRRQPDEKMFQSARQKRQALSAGAEESTGAGENLEPIRTEKDTDSEPQKDDMTLNAEEIIKTPGEKGPAADGMSGIGKGAAIIGKGIGGKILAGVAAVAVVAGIAGYVAIQKKNTSTDLEQNAVQTAEQKGTEEAAAGNKTEIAAEKITENVTGSETETETQTETQTETEKQGETVLETIEDIGYTYIGGSSYDVTYNLGTPYQSNGPDAGISLDAAPTGVAGAMKRDTDGDGKEELLLAVLKPADQVFLNNGKKDAKLYFEVYHEDNGEWALQGETTAEQAYTVRLTEVLANIKVVCTGTTIYIRENGNGTFPSDSIKSGEKYEYNGSGFTAITNEDLGYVDGLVSDEFENAVAKSGEEDFLCEFIIPEIYEGGHTDLISALYSGVPINVTLQLRDNGWVEGGS